MGIGSESTRRKPPGDQADGLQHNLPRWRRFAYGFGDFGFNLYFATASLFLLYFYTDVLGLPSSTAGLIFLIALVWDGVTDPLMGWIAEKTRTRWGSYRPYLLFGIAPLSVTMVLLFYKPDAEGTGLVVFAAATHVLFRTAFTVLAIPFSSLSARMTRDTGIRNELAAARMVFATLAGLFVASSTLRLVGYFGEGDAAKGFAMTAALYAALSIPIIVSVFFTAREPEMGEHKGGGASAGLRQGLAGVPKNGPLLIVVSATILAVASGFLTSKTLIYYYKYTLGNENAAGTALAVLSGGAAVFVPIWAFVATKTSKRTVWLSGLVIGIGASMGIWFNPVETVPVVTALFAVSGLATAASYLSFWSTLPDTVEYGEWRSGVRTESLIFGLISFAQKSAFGVAGLLLGLLLDWAGYEANAPQSPETLYRIKMIMTLVPAGLAATSAAIVAFYPLDRTLHGRLTRAIEWRKGRANRQRA